MWSSTPPRAARRHVLTRLDGKSAEVRLCLAAFLAPGPRALLGVITRRRPRILRERDRAGRRTSIEQRRFVGLVAPLPPQVGGVASVAEWLLAHEQEIGCRFVPFDLARPPDEESGGRFRPGSFLRQIRLLADFLHWSFSSPPLVHYCVSCTPTGIARDVTFLALLRAARRQTVAHVHGGHLKDIRHSRFRSRAMRAAARLSVDVVAISPRSASMLQELGIPCRHILNPIRLEPRETISRNRAASLRLLFAGTYGERKGCIELLDAVAEARARRLSVRLLFVGREEHKGEEKALRARVAALGLSEAVEFAGVASSDQLRRHYEEADAVVLPSRKEGLPMTILEAMAFGLPVVATAVGGIPDVVQDGRTGVLVQPGDVGQLADAIALLEGDVKLRLEMGRAGQEWVMQAASSETLAREWRNVYDGVWMAGVSRESRRPHP